MPESVACGLSYTLPGAFYRKQFGFLTALADPPD